MIAVQDNLFSYAELLLLFKANPNLACFPQSVALLTENLVVAQKITESVKKNTTGDTALHLACRLRKDAFIPLLLSHKANPHQLNVKRLAPYLYLLLNPEVPINHAHMQLFIDRRIDIDLKILSTKLLVCILLAKQVVRLTYNI